MKGICTDMGKRFLEAAAVCMLTILLAVPAFFDQSLQRKRESAEAWGGTEKEGEAEDEDGASPLPARVWTEPVTCGDFHYTITFERLSVPCTEAHESAGTPDCGGNEEEKAHEAVKAEDAFADYRLSVRRADGELLSEQTVPHFPVCFEETLLDLRFFGGRVFGHCVLYVLSDRRRLPAQGHEKYVFHMECGKKLF